MFAKQGSQVRRSTPANLSSVGAARDDAGQAELESLQAQLEAARQAAGEAIGVFYDPRQNAEHAANLQRSHSLREEMASLMQRAEAWGRAASGADEHDRSAAEAEPEE
ncbi:hypothetical protein ACLMJV_31010 [Sinorhizobium meliloti]|uniref:hypothetical protein n=1 Tax=Rhizobium meliloti TaxID=382 RepID=UPI00398C8977